MRNMQRFRSSITWCRHINRILKTNRTSRYPRASREWETSYVLHSLVKRPSALRARRTKEKNERYIQDEHAGTTMRYFSPRTIRASLFYPGNLTMRYMCFLPPWVSLRYPRNFLGTSWTNACRKSFGVIQTPELVQERFAKKHGSQRGSF